MVLRSLCVSGLSNIRHPLSGGPAEVHDASACAPAAFNHGSVPFIQSHREAFSVLLQMDAQRLTGKASAPFLQRQAPGLPASLVAD